MANQTLPILWSALDSVTSLLFSSLLCSTLLNRWDQSKVKLQFANSTTQHWYVHTTFTYVHCFSSFRLMTHFYYDSTIIFSSRSFVCKMLLHFLLLSVIKSTPINLVNFCLHDLLPHTFSSASLSFPFLYHLLSSSLFFPWFFASPQSSLISYLRIILYTSSIRSMA